jgi:short-subunit dehydrogenase
MKSVGSPQCIVITGASSGIGEALAREYAAPGIRLALTGRNEHRLEQVTAACRQAGADVIGKVIDVTDSTAMQEWLFELDHTMPVDLVIANAGISAGTWGGGEAEDRVRALFAVNVGGVLNTIHPLLPAMRQRGRGQIAIMSSLAAFRGFPGAAAYSASKAAVKAYGEALRILVKPDGIGVSVICPGFIKSRITDANQFRMPFLMEADRAARRIRKGLKRNRARIAFPLPMYIGIWLLSLLPPALVDPLLAKSPAKQ